MPIPRTEEFIDWYLVSREYAFFCMLKYVHIYIIQYLICLSPMCINVNTYTMCIHVCVSLCVLYTVIALLVSNI